MIFPQGQWYDSLLFPLFSWRYLSRDFHSPLYNCLIFLRCCHHQTPRYCHSRDLSLELEPCLLDAIFCLYFLLCFFEDVSSNILKLKWRLVDRRYDGDRWYGHASLLCLWFACPRHLVPSCQYRIFIIISNASFDPFLA